MTTALAALAAAVVLLGVLAGGDNCHGGTL